MGISTIQKPRTQSRKRLRRSRQVLNSYLYALCPWRHQQFWVFDNIGNRISALEGTEPTEPSDYTANNLNQYTQREVADVIDVLGSVNTGTTVTVNNQAVTRQGDHYWHTGLDITNAASSVYEGVSVVGVYNPPGTNDPDVITVESGNVFVAETPEGFTYDDDGNLTADGRWDYTWNSENRLTQIETADAVTNVVPRQKLVFSYDYMGRRVSKIVMAWNGSAWETNSVRRFLYDGWLLVREQSRRSPGEGGNSTNHYVWGRDLSGSLQGAGGIGGLLAAQLYNPTTSNSTTVLYTYCANGNVSELVDMTGTNILAHYEYSPFGAAVVSEGDLAEVNAIRFSTKYWDDETGLGYWGYRWYGTSIARWLSRDPAEERHDLGLNCFVRNDPLNLHDKLGLATCPKCPADRKARPSTSSKCGTEYRTKQQQKVPSCNGCGGEGFIDAFPDGDVFMLWDFGPACDGHDLCYSKCGSEKKDCDEVFLNNMKEVCAAYRWMPITWFRCNLQALTYGTAVMRLGGHWFDKAQDEHCKWEPCCK